MIFQVFAATLWFLLGVGLLAGSKTVMHEIIATLLLSFAVLFVGVACVIYAVRESHN